MMSHEYYNFLSIKTAIFNYKENNYYTILVRRWEGKYRYPNINKGFESYQVIDAFVFTEEEFEKIYDFEGLQELKAGYHVELRLKDVNNIEQKLLDLIQTQLEKGSRPKFIFPILKSEEGQIRFYIPREFIKYFEYNFEKGYFETSQDNFNKIMIN